mgnify:CR=1 FL=1|jgi:hypothetical protein
MRFLKVLSCKFEVLKIRDSKKDHFCFLMSGIAVINLIKAFNFFDNKKDNYLGLYVKSSLPLVALFLMYKLLTSWEQDLKIKLEKSFPHLQNLDLYVWGNEVSRYVDKLNTNQSSPLELVAVFEDCLKNNTYEIRFNSLMKYKEKALVFYLKKCERSEFYSVYGAWNAIEGVGD